MKYNPYLPQDLGQEWVPIRNEDLILDPFANSLERGYGFTLPSASVVNNVRFYINTFPPLFVRNQGYTANIYPRGQEAESGPVRSVLIPCNNGTVTGAGVTVFPAGTPVSSAVYNPSANSYLLWQIGNSITNIVSFFFATNSYAQLLNGKRILGVNLLTGVDIAVAASADPDDWAPTFTGWIFPYLTNDAMLADPSAFIGGGFTTYRPLVTFQSTAGTRLLVRTRLGDSDMAYGATGSFTTSSPNILQWTYSELQRFEASAANRLFITLASLGFADVGAQVRINYMAMEVFFCEERRVAFGTNNILGLTGSAPQRPGFQLGMNQILVRDLSGATNPSLAAGDYTVTLSEANTGDDFGVAFSPFETAKVNELRQLYEIPSLPGIQINLPFPLNEEAIDTTFTKETTALIPQLSMHTSGGVVLTESHGYGRQAVGQVFGNNFVTQDIDDSAIAMHTSYPWVRFYARRFGNTSVPLTLAGFTPAGGVLLNGVSGTYVNTPDNAVLDIVGDIDLRVDFTPNDWTPAGTAALISKWGVAGQRSYLFQLTTTGLLELAWSADGTATIVKDSTAAIPITQGRLVVRATLDVNNGAAGNDVIFYYGPTLDGPWTQLGTTVTTAGVTSIFSGTLAVEIGSQSLGTTSMLAGVVHAAQIHPGINVAPVATPNFDAQAVGTTSFVDSAGRTWTLQGSALIIEGVASSGTSVSITPTEFDALEGILDGWKEVVLRFTTVPQMGAISPTFKWTALGELPGSRWEVLGASAYAASGIAQQMPPNIQLAQVPAAQQLYSSTYGAPSSGATINAEWLPQLGPYVSGAAQDQAADMSIIFAQDMPTVTGFTIATASQAISGIGQNCGINPCGIPTRILYNQLSWGLPVNTGLASDDFTRTVSNGFGTATRGGAYSLSATAAEYVVNGTQGAITPAVINTMTLATLSSIGIDADVTVTISNNGAMVAGSNVRGVAVARFTNINNYYSALIQSTAAGAHIIGFQKTVAGVETVLGTANLLIGINDSNKLKLRFLLKGTLLKAKAWSVYDVEPTNWQIEITDTSLVTGSGVGVGARTGVSTGNTLLFDDLIVGPPDFWFKHYEMQRSDELTEWQTIMECTSPNVTGFRDFEARTDMASNYRVRNVDVYGFPGPWSSTVTSTIPTPGVSGSCLGGAHVMIFTTNERQDGSSNLAYSNAWEDEVEEGFGFAEAGFTQLQPMYNKDFFTAFRPTERGGDQFSRDILVQAAAIAPETLADFQSLRDMAWEDVSYICLRDEEGNRWFVNVNVPSGVVKNRRRLYLASVQIVEVTDTPSPVNP
jgi:hypothetical protein